VQSSSNLNDLVLDPFCGSATTGVSALLNGRRFIGIDAEEKYLNEYAIPRLKETIKTVKERLF
jgi:site-specific DNA-methyltransferase (adenine-specific)